MNQLEIKISNILATDDHYLNQLKRIMAEIEEHFKKECFEIRSHRPGWNCEHVKFINGTEKDAALEVAKYKLISKDNYYYKKVEV